MTDRALHAPEAVTVGQSVLSSSADIVSLSLPRSAQTCVRLAVFEVPPCVRLAENWEAGQMPALPPQR